MKIEIVGDPGTGNTFSETHIGYVENYNPNLTSLVVNRYGEGKKKEDEKKVGMDEMQKLVLKKDILDYVGKLSGWVSPKWKERYEPLWLALLAIPEVDRKVYDKGRQKDTTFNRNLVANIIHILVSKGVIEGGNNYRLTKALEGDDMHSVRGELGKLPQDEGIEKAVCEVIDKYSA